MSKEETSARQKQYTIPVGKLILSILITLALVAGFIFVMAQVEDRYYRKESAADREQKTQGIRHAMETYDRDEQEIGRWFQTNVNTTVEIMCIALENQAKNGDYSGPRMFEDGFVARIQDGNPELPEGYPERFPELTAEKIRQTYVSSVISDLSQSGEDQKVLATSGEFAEGWYYVDLTDYSEYTVYINAQLSQKNMLATLCKAYSGELFLVSRDNMEGSFLFTTEGFADYEKLSDLGLNAGELEKETLILHHEQAGSYQCYPILLENMNAIAVFCEPESSRVASRIDRLLTLGIFAASLFAVLITWGVSLAGLMRSNLLTEQEKRIRYSPERIKRITRRAGGLAFIMVFLVALFSRSLQYLYHCNMDGRETVEILENKLSDSVRKTADVEQQEVQWYIYFGHRMGSLIARDQELTSREKLAEFSDCIDADYIMIYDENGNEMACSTDYIGFSLGTEAEDSSTDFRRILKGVRQIAHEPETDMTTGLERQHIAVRIDLPGEKERFGVLLMAVKPETIMRARLSNTEIRILNQLVTEGEVMIKIDPETKEILSSSMEKLIGQNAVNAGIPEDSIQPGRMTFFYIGDIWYYGVSGNGENPIWYFASEGTGMLLTAVTYALLAAVLFAIGYVILAFYLLGKMVRRRFRVSEEGQVIGKLEGRMEERLLKRRRTPSDSMPGKIHEAAVSHLWHSVHYPEKKARIVFYISLGLMMVCLLLSATGNDALSRNAVLSFVIAGDWPRGLNIFAITAVFMVICIGTLTFIITKIVFHLLGGVLETKGATICKLAHSILEYVIAAVVLYYALSFLGVNTTTLLASMGLVSLAVSLGAQSLMSDIVAGLGIVFEGNFQVGDIVEIGNYRGTVLEIGVRSTRLLTEGDNVRIINNHEIHNVLNMSKMNSWYPMEIDLPLTQSTDELEEVFNKELPNIGKAIPEIVSGPIYKGITAIKPNGMTIAIYAEYREKDYYKVQRKLNHAIKKLLQEKDIAFKGV